ncbi:MAG: hypothetical protein A2259_05275 [Candidatus Moranbacteria bacterium RIFOXYA2_FULL_43_15]|nr:MAG: hypothetical protein A2259_05275 [Candidatus Moranbacteria bacterium RIFOXYA2_FULL_43_15]
MFEKEVQEKVKKIGAIDFIVKADVTPKQVTERVKEIMGRQGVEAEIKIKKKERKKLIRGFFY